jgi:ligand-binding SRPBCC domain-containing protein
LSQRLRFEQWVPVPLARVFAFFSDPSNLPRIMPPQLGARLVRVERVPPPGSAPEGGEAGVGTVIVVSVKLLPPFPVRTEWVARIVEYERGRHFADVQDRGPFRRWEHRHEFEARCQDGRDGTVVRDVLEYEVGLGLLGTVAERLLVGRQMTRTFEHRQRTLEALLASS